MAPSLPKTYKAAVLTGVNEKLQIQELPMPELKHGEILVKVLACGVCHSDAGVIEGMFGPPQIKQLGHEYIGDVVAIPEGETKWTIGDRVGGAWHGGHDQTCRSCARGVYQMCDNKTINGVFREGGYGEYATIRTEAAVRIPKDAPHPAKIAPLLCAGVTVFNGLRQMNVPLGDVVAVQGLGGLGHLAVQYARKMGFHTVAISRGADKKDFATKLGAHDYIDTGAGDAVKQLQALGGAACIICTAPNPDAIAPLIAGLAPRGKLLVLAPVGNLNVDTTALILNGLSVCGWPSGHAQDSEEAIAFALRNGVEVMTEEFELDRAQEAVDHMLSGKVRFRAVLTM